MIPRSVRRWGRDITHRPSIYWLTAPVYHRLLAPISGAAISSLRRIRSGALAALRHRVQTRKEDALSRRLRKVVWSMSRSYRSQVKVNIPGDFDAILAGIASGERVTAAELLPYLCMESREQRCEVNALLADAYAQSDSVEDLEQAKIFIQRAWLLSGCSPNVFPLYLKILSALNDVVGIREGYKRLGMCAAQNANVSEAIHNFTFSHYASLLVEKVDRFQYDFDILRCMDDLAAPHRFDCTGRGARGEGEKIRLAYLLKGTAELNSVLLKINLLMARLHDKSRFEITFFTPEPERVIAIAAQGKDHIKQFESFGCKLVSAPDLESEEEILLGIGRRIYEARPHILVTSAALADFRHYFVAALRPAPVMIGLVQGPPPQFAAPLLDWCIAWSKHPLMDSPVGCSLVELRLPYSGPQADSAYSRNELELPEDATVLISGGRYTKFQEADYWTAIIDVLSRHANTYYLVVGPREDQIPFLNSILPPEVKSRVRCLGWREDFQKILPCADILIDTYPSGGGQVLVQAFSSGLPIVSYQNDYMKLYDQTNWNPVEDFIADSEIIVPRGDFQQFKEIVSKLIEDKQYRRLVAERCQAQYAGRINAEESIRQCEDIYVRVLDRVMQSQTPSDPGRSL